MIKLLVNKLPDGAVISPHPSFVNSESLFASLKQYVDEVSDGKIGLCNKDVIIELEMLYESKNFIGPQTSVSRYAKYFNSRFENIKLY